MKLFAAIASVILLNACTFNVHVIKEDESAAFRESADALRLEEGSTALVSIAGRDYPCQVTKVSDDRLVFEDKDAVHEIPLKAITSITVYHKKADHPSMIAGVVIGGVTGLAVGTAISRGRSHFTSGSAQRKLQAASSAAGSLAGMLAVAGWGSNAGETYELNSDVKCCRIAQHESITGMEAMQSGSFKDLKFGVGEQLLKVHAYQFDPGGYLIVYETHDGQTTKTRWSVVDSQYMQRQEMLLRSSAASSGTGLNLFKEAGN